MKKLFILLLLVYSPTLFAQDAKDDASIDEIEGLFNETEEEDVRSARPSAPEKAESEGPKVKDLADLSKLETFDDIAVIQRRYLPKTGRFELYIAGGTNLNDSFFVGNGINLRFGYYLSERWGIEGIYSYIQNDNRDVTNELLNRGVNTEGMVATDQYMGADIKWTPIYGKYAYFNEKIIPFDLYFSAGMGMTTPKLGDSAANTSFSPDQALTYRVGTGQIFALTKWMAFRWDLSWHFFSAKSTINSSESLHNNLFLNVGLSFFFPEAKYR
ncbi:MAG: outer membrane beta-barrel domain-containing protein [Bdellovibrionales bacterium]|nr:outer membrane beta-barrel domain-containing protein [Bdellovibrionales bacterium]